MMESSNYNQFDNVYVFGNGVGLHEKNSKGNNYRTGCWFVLNGVPYIPSDDLEGSHATGIYLENSSPEIAGAIISGDEGDGIRSESGSDPLIRKCNIHDNDGAALNNLDLAITISAQDNWWGDASGPGGIGPGAGDEISGTVDFANWRAISVTLVAVAEQDPLLAARGATDANPVHVHNWEVFSDTVRVTLADSLGWLVGPETFTVTLKGPAATVPVSFTVPAGAAIGTTDNVTVTVVSQADPSATDTESFQVVAALVADLAVAKESIQEITLEGPRIRFTVEVSNEGPDAATGVVLTDTLPMTATVVSVTPSQGSCTQQEGAITCDLGVLDSTAQATVAVVVSAEGFDGIPNIAEVDANEHDPDLRNNFDVEYATIVAVAPRFYLPLMLRN